MIKKKLNVKGSNWKTKNKKKKVLNFSRSCAIQSLVSARKKVLNTCPVVTLIFLIQFNFSKSSINQELISFLDTTSNQYQAKQSRQLTSIPN